MRKYIRNDSINKNNSCTDAHTESSEGSDTEKRMAGVIQEANGYFTVEAAMVFPVALGTVLFIVYMLIFQYDRCLLEQDMGALALWGSRVRAESSAELRSLIQKQTNEIYKDKYAVWKMLVLDVKLEHNRFTATGKGQLAFPVPGMNFWNRENVWTAEAEYRFWRILPTDFVRLCNRVKTWWETEDEIEDAEG